MQVKILTKNKTQRYMEIIYKLGDSALHNGDYELFEKAVDLMHEICGIQGLNYGKAMADKAAQEIGQKILEEAESEYNL